jgi:SAM-dependent methyltransferase
MKYSQLGTTKSRLVRRTQEELRRRGLRHVMRLGFRSISVHLHRHLLSAGRYIRWTLMKLRPAGAFVFQGRKYRYFLHPYNATWRNERAVEIPIVQHAIDNTLNGRVLEVGNVLGHYTQREHDIVDKYEPGANVVNVDILEFNTKEPYDLIVSVSTLEHVGWDDDERDPGKIIRAVEHLRSLIAPGGRAIITLPLGYNGYLDGMLSEEALAFDHQHYLVRVSRTEWHEAEKAELGRPIYGRPFPGANAIVIGIIERSP